MSEYLALTWAVAILAGIGVLLGLWAASLREREKNLNISRRSVDLDLSLCSEEEADDFFVWLQASIDWWNCQGWEGVPFREYLRQQDAQAEGEARND